MVVNSMRRKIHRANHPVTHWPRNNGIPRYYVVKHGEGIAKWYVVNFSMTGKGCHKSSKSCQRSLWMSPDHLYPIETKGKSQIHNSKIHDSSPYGQMSSRQIPRLTRQQADSLLPLIDIHGERTVNHILGSVKFLSKSIRSFKNCCI